MLGSTAEKSRSSATARANQLGHKKQSVGAGHLGLVSTDQDRLGGTLDHAFIILDEAQNATEAQLKMFLTRIGPSARCIITGDLTQIDLPRNQRSGLFNALRLLKDIDGIGTVFLDEKDVVRHRLVKQIIKAYDKDRLEHEAREED